jgi:integrase
MTTATTAPVTPRSTARKRGEGCIYSMRGSRFLWIKWYDGDGKAHYESTGTEDVREARKTLRQRLAKVDAGEVILPKADKVRFAEAAEDLRAHYRTTGRRDLQEVEKRLTPLLAFFSGRLIRGIGPADVTAYVSARQSQTTRRKGAPANGTINRELGMLGKLLRLAYENGKLLRVPVVKLLKEAAPRAGFFDAARYEAVRAHLRPDLQVACDLAYTFGWRIRDEVLTLERRQIDFEAGTIRLEPGQTKNRDGRVIYLTPELSAALRTQLERVRVLEKTLKRVIPYVFPHLDGPHQGTRVRDFRRTWGTACIAAGLYRTQIVPGAKPGETRLKKVPIMLRHDFRRTAARNLVNAGVPERVAMAILGHKTRSVFDRYHIVAPSDLKAAAERIAARA